MVPNQRIATIYTLIPRPEGSKAAGRSHVGGSLMGDGKAGPGIKPVYVGGDYYVQYPIYRLTWSRDGMTSEIKEHPDGEWMPRPPK